MVAAGICLALLAFAVWHRKSDQDRRIDEHELRFLRRMADRDRTDHGMYE